MANCEHASIDVKRLAASLRENLETVQSLSEECCIYRVPQQTRCLNESAFTPQVISIGPLHHGKEELKEMEEHKRRNLKRFLKRTKILQVPGYSSSQSSQFFISLNNKFNLIRWI